jgi:hypothetical protein
VQQQAGSDAAVEAEALRAEAEGLQATVARLEGAARALEESNSELKQVGF